MQEEPLIDLARASKESGNRKSNIWKQLQMYLNSFVPEAKGFDEIKLHLFSNDTTLMYRAAHKQVPSTKMVGLFRLSLILDQMQRSVYQSVDSSVTNPPPNFAKY